MLSLCSYFVCLCYCVVCLHSHDVIVMSFWHLESLGLWPILLFNKLSVHKDLYFLMRQHTVCTVFEMQEWAEKKHKHTLTEDKAKCCLLSFGTGHFYHLQHGHLVSHRLLPPANGSSPPAHVPHKWRTERRHGDLAVAFTAGCLLKCACDGKISNTAFKHKQNSWSL